MNFWQVLKGYLYYIVTRIRRPGSSINWKYTHLDIFQCVYLDYNTDFILGFSVRIGQSWNTARFMYDCLKFLFCFFQQIEHRAGEGEHIKMEAAVGEGKRTLKSWKSCC